MLIVQNNNKFSEDIEAAQWTDALDSEWIKSLFSLNPWHNKGTHLQFKIALNFAWSCQIHGVFV